MDKYLLSVPEQSGCDGYMGLKAVPSKSFADQELNSTTWNQPELWG